ncbi:MAG: NYN domain-containing protein [bacterium]
MNKPVLMSPAAAAWLVGQLDDRTVVNFLRGFGPAVSAITRGFQLAVTGAGLPTIRRRLAAATGGDAQLAGELLAGAAMPWAELRTALAKQPTAELRQSWRRLAREPVSGGTILLALVTHPEAQLAARACRSLLRNAWWERLVAALPAPSLPAPAVQPVPVTNHERDASWRHRLLAVETALKEERARYQQDRRALEKQVAESGRELAALQLRVASEVAAGVQLYRRETLGVMPELIAATLPEAAETTAALLARTEAALAHQQQVDERHARRAQLRAEIAELEAARDRLGVARRDSALVLPELEVVGRELAMRAETLRRLLGGDEWVRGSQLATLFLREVGAVAVNTTGILRLEELMRWLHQEPLRTLLSTVEREALGALVTQRQAELRRLAIAHALTAAAAPRPPVGPREVANLGWALLAAPDKPPLLLVDACNVLLVLPDYAAVATLRMAEERPRLSRVCQRRSAGFAGIELIYDGQGAVSTRENQGNGVTEVFAAHRGEDQNADDYIVRRVADLVKDPQSPPVWLVTADFGLRNRAAAAGCVALISPAAFQAHFDG